MIARTLLNYIPLKPCFKGTCKVTYYHAGNLYDILVVNTTVVLTVIYIAKIYVYSYCAWENQRKILGDNQNDRSVEQGSHALS